MDLFESSAQRHHSLTGVPLAERMRPEHLEDYVGQEGILGPGKILRRLIDNFKNNSSQQLLPSMIFWGPPGTGKTTLAQIIAKSVGAHFDIFSAVSSGVKDARAIIEAARDRKKFNNGNTVLFVDEIHRFNKSQQDAFLPAVEAGIISLIGATTENPSFELNSALISRSRVFILKALDQGDIEKLLRRALVDKSRGLGKMQVDIDDEALRALCNLAGGDARTALNALELAALSADLDPASGRKRITRELAEEALQRNSILYDASGEEHYNIISAFHKSLRASDPQASLYYLARMIQGGEDPFFIARRLIRAASEDVGLADPQALVQALAAKDTVELLGYPECDIALAQAVIYVATAPKSNAVYNAMNAAKAEVQESGPLPVPLHFRNAVTSLMKNEGYGKGYRYDHDFPDHVAPQERMPDKLRGKIFYTPGNYSFEKEVAKRMEWFETVRKKLESDS